MIYEWVEMNTNIYVTLSHLRSKESTRILAYVSLVYFLYQGYDIFLKVDQRVQTSEYNNYV